MWSGRARATERQGNAQRYPVKITVFCDDRTGMLKELTAVISDENTNIRGVDLSRDEEGEAIIEFVVEAEDVRHLNRMVLGLRRVAGVRAGAEDAEGVKAAFSFWLLAICLFAVSQVSLPILKSKVAGPSYGRRSRGSALVSETQRMV